MTNKVSEKFKSVVENINKTVLTKKVKFLSMIVLLILFQVNIVILLCKLDQPYEEIVESVQESNYQIVNPLNSFSNIVRETSR